MRTLLKLCYLLVFTLFIACGESAEKSKSNEKGTEKISAESAEKDSIGSKKTIVFFGNSLTAGMGLEPEQSFPAVISDKLDSLNLDYFVINAGISGETTAGGESRIGWLMRDPIDVFILELGANDGLRGIPLSETRENLQAIIDTVKENNPGVKIVLAGMQIPPNMGPEYTSEFRQIFPDLAEKNEVYLIPFLLEDVAGIPELNQADGIHPTIEGQRIVAENVWEILQPILDK
ncbi:MAG: arylesterase [Muriicola sp.]|nr:arylesterase [Muriicola sp.]MBT8282846.1 arylesterase [Muriicola sp.]NNK12152.1 arylesterase [Flavobacteriaceae bacterium]